MEEITQRVFSILEPYGLQRHDAKTVVYLCAGLSNKEIGAKLFRAEKTIKCRLTKIFRVTKQKSRAKLMVWINKKLEETTNE